jgi:hypothetical protein
MLYADRERQSCTDKGCNELHEFRQSQRRVRAQNREGPWKLKLFIYPLHFHFCILYSRSLNTMLHYLILLLHDVIGFSNNYLIIGECLKEN